MARSIEPWGSLSSRLREEKMGISRGTIKLLAMSLKGEKDIAKVLTFGVQGVQSGYAEATAAIRQTGLIPRSLPDERIIYDEVTQFGKTIHQTTLFQLLGCDMVESIDYFPDEHPTFVADLNLPIADRLAGQYSLVYDGGTMEHCFNPARVMENAVALAKPGGMVLHHVPMNNWVDHGFYQFSPTLFFDFYGANGFTDLVMQIHFLGRGKESYFDYDPISDEALPYFVGNKTRALVFFRARKPMIPAEKRFPIQGRYMEVFGQQSSVKVVAGSGKGLVGRLKRSLRKRTIKFRSIPL
jgi:SAM-dependent methyltransferase